MKNINKKQKNKLNIAKYFKRYWLAVLSYILVYAVAAVCNIFSTILLARSVEQITNNQLNEAIITFVYILVCLIVRRIMWYSSGLIYNTYSIKIMSAINYDMSQQAFKLNSKTYNDHDTGTFVQRIVSDPERIVYSSSDMVDILSDVVSSLIMLVYISTLNIYVALIMIATMIVGLIIEYFRLKAKRRNRHIKHKAHDDLSSLTTEIIHSEKDIKSLGLEKQLNIVSKEKYATYQKAVFKDDTTDMTMWSTRNLLVEILGIVLLIVCVFVMNADPGVLTLSAYMIIYSNRESARVVIWGFGEMANKIVDIRVSTERMSSLFDEEEFVTEKFGNIDLENVVGKVEFKHVGYTFYEYATEEKQTGKKRKKGQKPERQIVSQNKVFDDLSFEIEPNKTVAFVGKSGSGKSTILNLMSKMFEVESGEVLIDGVNINDLTKNSLRSTISLVNQFPYIFDMTIKENLLLAKEDATDEELDEAIQKAYLTEFVNSLAKGVDTKVGESGIKLSGGQKQRLAIARAMLRKSPILIFDESTSSLDNFAQEEVKKSIDGLKGQSTIVIVAHRLSTIKNVDKIFFLDNGQIIDSGTFDELFKRNEKFQNMFLAENI